MFEEIAKRKIGLFGDMVAEITILSRNYPIGVEYLCKIVEKNRMVVLCLFNEAQVCPMIDHDRIIDRFFNLYLKNCTNLQDVYASLKGKCSIVLDNCFFAIKYVEEWPYESC